MYTMRECFQTLQLIRSSEMEALQKVKKLLLRAGKQYPSAFLVILHTPLLPFLMKEFANGGRNEEEQFFGWRLSSARMVIECAFGRLKGRFGCLRRDMDINIKDLPHVIHACFILQQLLRNEKGDR